jgi:hypothetical protein
MLKVVLMQHCRADRSRHKLFCPWVCPHKETPKEVLMLSVERHHDCYKCFSVIVWWVPETLASNVPPYQ